MLSQRSSTSFIRSSSGSSLSFGNPASRARYATILNPHFTRLQIEQPLMRTRAALEQGNRFFQESLGSAHRYQDGERVLIREGRRPGKARKGSRESSRESRTSRAASTGPHTPSSTFDCRSARHKRESPTTCSLHC